MPTARVEGFAALKSLSEDVAGTDEAALVAGTEAAALVADLTLRKPSGILTAGGASLSATAFLPPDCCE
jgi:hypothetical protein